jgi:gliding motility-associated lipoprotein GldH
MKRTWVFLTLSALLMLGGLSGCSRPYATMEQEFPGACWDMGDTLTLRFENTDTAKVYQLWFPLVLTDAYAYNNLYLHAEVTPPSGERSVLPARFPLMEADGTWKGEVQGKEVKFDLLMAGAIRLNQVGGYEIKCYQYMRDSLLCGVQSAGITLDVRQASDSAAVQ